jgi:hypothetical protein
MHSGTEAVLRFRGSYFNAYRFQAWLCVFDLFVKYLGWKEEEVEVFLAAVRKDILNRGIHAYATLVCVIGQKPRAEAGSQEEQDPG